MRYTRTPLRRLLNLLEHGRVSLGIGPRHRHLLTTVGRRTGRRITTPVGIVEHGGERWLVGPYGEVGWVRNARATGRVTLARGGRRAEYRIEELEPPERGAILQRYIALEPITRPFFEAGSDTSTEASVAEAARHPVFRLEPAAERVERTRAM